jgi:chorismate-pyruvate lyase
MPPDRATPDLHALVALFYDTPDPLGEFELVEPDAMPEGAATLLAHENHMTVTVERFHHSPVDVEVLDKRITPSHYARKILLRKQSDSQVVQYGIMRVNFEYFSDAVRQEIEDESTPLGRILIQHQVLRDVQLDRLWEIVPGGELRKLFGLENNRPVFGRTAIIFCNGEPAIELLEIVTPV